MPSRKKTEKRTRPATKRSTRKTSTRSGKASSGTKAETIRAIDTDILVATADTPKGVPELPIDTGETIDDRIDEITTNIAEIDDIGVRIEPPYIPPPPPVEYGISRKVLARIASLAAGEVQGLMPPRRDPLYRIIESIQGRTDGIRVDMGTTEAAVDMLIRVQYGSHIPDVTSRLRESIVRRIHEMTGLKVVEFNVRIQDVTQSSTSAT